MLDLLTDYDAVDDPALHHGAHAHDEDQQAAQQRERAYAQHRILEAGHPPLLG